MARNNPNNEGRESALFVYFNDSQIIELHAYRHDDKKNPRIEITVGAT